MTWHPPTHHATDPVGRLDAELIWILAKPRQALGPRRSARCPCAAEEMGTSRRARVGGASGTRGPRQPVQELGCGNALWCGRDGGDPFSAPSCWNICSHSLAPRGPQRKSRGEK